MMLIKESLWTHVCIVVLPLFGITLPSLLGYMEYAEIDFAAFAAIASCCIIAIGVKLLKYRIPSAIIWIYLVPILLFLLIYFTIA